MASAQLRLQPGALVVGGDYQGLGIVRSLGRRGIPVCVVDDEWSIARFSRYATHVETVADLRDECNAVDAVLAIARRLGLKDWVLFPTRDELVAAFSRHKHELETIFRVPTGDWTSVQWAWDKRNTYRLAERLGIPTPRTWHPCCVSDLEGLEHELPLVIKPAIKEHFFYATKAKAWRTDTPSQLRKAFLSATSIAPSEIMVQEFIPGDGQLQFAYCAFFKDGDAIGSMTVRRLRQHPPDFGRASTYVETVKRPELQALSKRFLQAIQFYGLVELEYKLDPRNGQFKLLDVNARTWGYHTLGARAGVDFPYVLFADQVGDPQDSCHAKTGINWCHMVTDLPTSLLEIINGRLSACSYFRSLMRCHTEAVFSRDDIMPGIAELALLPYLAVKRGF
jgi:D-aspartate ligase